MRNVAGNTAISGGWDAVGLATDVRQGRISAEELVAETLDRIESFDSRLRSYVSIDQSGALTAARAADELLRQVGPEGVPPFLGVPLSIKDVIDVAGMPTTHSCKALANNIATADAPLVRRFRDAGFVIVGKTNIPEFCSSMTTSELNGICRNPWDLELTPGGSSGGAAAALASGLCAVAHGTDGAGSVRTPAAYCGLVGLKPSRRLVAFDPQEDHPYFGTSEAGLLTRSVRDAASVLDVMVGTEPMTLAWSPRPREPYAQTVGKQVPRLRVAVSVDPPFGDVDPVCAAPAFLVGQVLESLGHNVDMDTPNWAAILVAAATPMTIPGAAAWLSPDQYDLVEPRNRPMVSRLASMTVLEHSRTVDTARSATVEFLDFWESFDLLVTPTCGILPPPVSWAPWDQSPEEHMRAFSSFPNFAQPFNISGQPAVSLPLGWSPDGLPIGVQLAGRPLDEGLLLAVAAQLEQAMPWSDRGARAYEQD